MSTIERQQGELRPRTPRADRMPKTPAAELAAPHRDPATGRWKQGNPGSRIRQLAALGRAEAQSLLRLAPDSVAPWLRSHLQSAQQHVQELVNAMGPRPPAELVALAGDEGKARLMANAALTEGSREGTDAKTAREWREEAMKWFREARQSALVRKGLARDMPPRDAPNSLLAAIEAAGDEAERQGAAQ